MKSVQIDIDPVGGVIIEAVGFKGKACEKATRAFEEALGKVKTKTKKPEYELSNVITQKVGG